MKSEVVEVEKEKKVTRPLRVLSLKTQDNFFTPASYWGMGVGVLAGLFSTTITIVKIWDIDIFGIGDLDSTPSTTIAVIAFLIGLWSAIQLLRKDLDDFSEYTTTQLRDFSDSINLDTTTGDKIHKTLIESGLLGKESLRLIEPHGLDEFERVFQRAKDISAYNPPLKLLVSKRGHRKVIENVLNNGSRYRVIAGSTCTTQLLKLRSVWLSDLKNDHSEDYIKKLLRRMEILIYKIDNDLHSKVEGWLSGGVDYRGLCYFLIKNGPDRTALMYILGAPFVRDFDVPSTAIAINSSDPIFELYSSMLSEYDMKWAKISAEAERENKNCFHTNLYDLIDFD